MEETNITKINEKPNIRDNWLKVDETCQSCGQVTKRATGITKQSMKRLFSFDYKNTQEWIWTIVIIGICFMAWSYKTDMAAYNNFMAHQTEYCTQVLADSQSQYWPEDRNSQGINLNGKINLSGSSDLIGIGNKTKLGPWITQ